MMNEATKVMTAQETLRWLENFFFGKMGIGSDFTEVYRGASTWIYEWNIDNNVEVIEVLGYDTETDDYYYEYVINFYNNATDGIPYRTGTTWVYGI